MPPKKKAISKASLRMAQLKQSANEDLLEMSSGDEKEDTPIEQIVKPRKTSSDEVINNKIAKAYNEIEAKLTKIAEERVQSMLEQSLSQYEKKALADKEAKAALKRAEKEKMKAARRIEKDKQLQELLNKQASKYMEHTKHVINNTRKDYTNTLSKVAAIKNQFSY